MSAMCQGVFVFCNVLLPVIHRYHYFVHVFHLDYWTHVPEWLLRILLYTVLYIDTNCLRW
jgi:hypothetical protein